ncbi:MAG: endonuclease/exonuclease/phosphatase family protein [Allorhizobium sp.]
MADKLARTIGILVFLVLSVVTLRYVTSFWLLSFFFSFQLHITLLAAAASLFCLLISRFRRGRLLLLASLLLAGHAVIMSREFLPQTATRAPEGETPLKVLSFNILGDNVKNGKRIADMIMASGADVAYVLEAGPLAPYLEALKATYPFRIGCGEATPTCDLLLLSRHPIIERQVATLSDLRRDRFAIADVVIAGKTVHFAAVHLSKPYFDDYHGEELEELGVRMARIGGTFVLGGDFNSAAIAPDMQKFLRDHQMTATGAEPATWPIEAGRFGIPIDHIFISPGIVAKSLQRIEHAMGSNHYGLIADLAVR